VCDCELGFRAAAATRRKGGGRPPQGVWADAAAVLQGFLADPWLLRPEGADGGAAVDAGLPATVQVDVPPLEPLPEEGEDEARRVAAQRVAPAAEDFARRFEAGRFGSPVSGSLPPSHPPSLSHAHGWFAMLWLGFALNF
jgi:hypothetical protein